MRLPDELNEGSDLVEDWEDTACGPSCTMCYPYVDPLEVLRREGHPVLYDAAAYMGEGWRTDHHEDRVEARRRSLRRRGERRVKRARWPEEGD